MSAITFDIPLLPVAKGAVKVSMAGGHAHKYQPKKTREYEQTFASLAAAHAPAALFLGPIALTLHFCLPLPPSRPAWQQAVKTAIHPVSKPDLTNLGKAAEDALTRCGRFWRDDSQVVRLHSTKVYGDQVGTTVIIEELLQPTRATTPKEIR